MWTPLVGLVLLAALWPLLRCQGPPPPVLGQVPEFSLVDERGEPFGSRQLEGSVWIANFVFTRCGSICPLLTRSMRRLQDRLDAESVDGVRLVSFTVDPEYDSPAILAEYADANGADPARWSFLTGEPATVRRTVEQGFKTAVGERVSLGENMMEIAHSGKFVVVDRSGAIRGYFDTDEPGLDALFRAALRLLDLDPPDAAAGRPG